MHQIGKQDYAHILCSRTIVLKENHALYYTEWKNRG